MTKTEEKIKRIIAISKMNKLYAPMVEAYNKGEMSACDLIIHYEAVYQESFRKSFKSLQEVKDESTRFAQERQVAKEGGAVATKEA